MEDVNNDLFKDERKSIIVVVIIVMVISIGVIIVWRLNDEHIDSESSELPSSSVIDAISSSSTIKK